MPKPPNSQYSHGGGKSTPATKQTSSGKKGFGLGLIMKSVHSAEHISEGLGQGVYDLGASTIHDINKARGANVKSKYELPVIAKATGKQMYGDIRHPERDPFSTLLTLSSLLAPALGTAARTGAALDAAGTAARGEKLAAALGAARNKPLYIRTYNRPAVPILSKSHKLSSTIGKLKEPGPVTSEVIPEGAATFSLFGGGKAVKGRKGLFSKPETVSRPVVKAPRAGATELHPSQGALFEEHSGSALGPYTAYGSRNPIFRAARQLTLEPMYRASLKRLEAGKGGRYASFRVGREEAQRARILKQYKNVHAEPTPPSIGKRLISTPTNIMRMGMFARPRYVVQNVGGTGIQLGIQQGPGLAKSIAMYRTLAQEHPKTLEKIVNGLGGTGTASIMTEAQGGAREMKILHKTASIVSAPESRMRPLSFFKAARDEGFTKPHEIVSLVENPEKHLEAWHRIFRKSNEEVTDYSRLGPGERKFMNTQLPIFYPMTKGFTRYAARFPGEHPVQAGIYGALGRQGSAAQQQKIGDRPYWAKYLVAVGGKPGHVQTIDPTLVSPFQPGTDVAREVGQGLNLLATGKAPIAGLTLASHLGPSPQVFYESVTGQQIPTGYPSREEPAGSFFRTVGPIPLIQALTGHSQKLKSFQPQSKGNALLEYFLGRTFAPRVPVPSQFKKQVRKEQSRRTLFQSPLQSLFGPPKKKGPGARAYQ